VSEVLVRWFVDGIRETVSLINIAREDRQERTAAEYLSDGGKLGRIPCFYPALLDIAR
jgi:hypothetical protein